MISKEGFVALASAFALLASGLKAYDDVSFAGLHMFALLVMLAAFVFFIGGFLKSRSREVQELLLSWPVSPKVGVGSMLAENGGEGARQATVMPCSASEFLFVDRQRGEGQQRFGVFKGLSRGRKSAIRAVIVRNATVNRELLEELVEFPNLGLIDIQRCEVEPEAWHLFAELNSLRFLAVFGAVDPREEREFAYTLPALQMIFEPTEFVPARAKVV